MQCNPDANEEIDGDTCDTDDPPLICEFCGDTAESLTTIEDSDPSVGYRGDLAVCAKCARKFGA